MEAEAHHVRVESLVMEGDPVDMILRAAEETHSDMIVMGTHGRTALARLLLGSVAEAVLRKAPCPVLTAKPVLDGKRLLRRAKRKRRPVSPWVPMPSKRMGETGGVWRRTTTLEVRLPC